MNTRIAAIREAMGRAARRSGRDPGDIHLLAVSKYKPMEALMEAYGAGQRDFGENYAQELAGKFDELPRDARLHFIGHLQSNKVKLIAGRAAWFHALDSVKLARRLNDRLENIAAEPLKVFIAVNVGVEDSKHGLPPDIPAVTEVVRAADALPFLELRGLMALPPWLADPEEVRPYFAQIRHLRDDIRRQTGIAMPDLSMGMSHDFEVAIEEGATWVRVGTAIFGER